MIRSMFTAINALNLYQSYMDVVADNLSNANTTGFKASRVTFQDQIAQILSIGAAPSANLGGINPIQIGLGSRIGSISATFVQGMLQSTGRSTDMAIEGDGFFIYSDGASQFYSRDGALSMDSEGYLVNSGTGLRIQGWQATGVGAGAQVDPNGPLSSIQIPLGTTLAEATTNVNLGGNLDSTATADVDVVVSVYDSLGAPHDVTMTFTRTGDNTWDWQASGSGATGSGSITFDADGQYTGGAATITLPAAGGATATTFDVDLSALTQLATETSASATSVNGLPAGSLVGFDVVSQTGEVLGVFSNGMKQLVGQVALATFSNPTGLVRNGQNLFSEAINAGEPNIGAPTSGVRGSIHSGYLEASNVDLAKEFTNMILAQRGFQASSRVITTSDEMMQELVNLKR